MAASISSLDAVLKESYVIGAITDQLNNNTDAWKDFEALTLQWTGKRCVIPLRVGRNTGVGAAAENGALPAAGQQTYVDLLVTARGVYGSSGISGFAVAAGANGQGIFDPTSLQQEMNYLVEDVKKIMTAFLFFGNSQIGLVWTKGAAVVDFEYSGRLDDTEDTFAGVPVGVGRTVQLVRLDTFATVGGVTQVNSITTVAGVPTMTVNAPINTAAVPTEVAMVVVYTNAGAGINPAIEPKGFYANLFATDHFSQDRALAANAEIRSNVRLADPTVASYQPLSTQALDRLEATAAKRSGKSFERYRLAIEQLIAYKALLQGVAAANLRSDVKDQSLKGDAGFKFLAHNGVGFVTSDMCPIGTIFGEHKGGYKRAVLDNGKWIDYNGVFQQVPGVDAGTARWRMYYDVVCIQPNAEGALTAIEIPT